MAVQMPAEEQLLPAPQKLEVANDALGIFMSELDWILRAVKDETEPMTVEEYVRLRDAGHESPDREFSEERILHLLVFASDTLQAVESIRADATGLRDELLAIFHADHEPNGQRDPDGWLAYKERMKQWHRERVGPPETRSGPVAEGGHDG